MNVKNFIPCEKCKNGFIIKNNIAWRCDCLLNYETHLKNAIGLCNANLITEETPIGIVEDLLSYDLCSYVGTKSIDNIEKCKKFVNEFDKKFNSINLFFQGENGTQKSTVARGMASLLIRDKKTAYYILGKDLICLLMDAERNVDAREKINQILSVDLLIIDEISPDKLALYSSNYKQEQLTPFLKTRIENIRKSVIFVSNVMIDEFKGSKLGDTLSDLIIRECKYGTFTFEDKFVENYDFVKDIKDIWD